VGELEGKQPPKYSKYVWHFSAIVIPFTAFTMLIWWLASNIKKIKPFFGRLMGKTESPATGVTVQKEMVGWLKMKKNELPC
jgi:hypothetical protein